MRKHLLKLGLLLLPLGYLAACSDDFHEEVPMEGTDLISLAGEIEQLATTRVNDSGFADGDVMGVYVVDYQDSSTPGVLANSGNRATNVNHTFDETNQKWNAAYSIYWKDKTTHVDIYGYYPAASPSDVNAYGFQVQTDQSTEPSGTQLGGYEASDFLWGMAGNVAPTQNTIVLSLKHKMSGIRVNLVEGDGFDVGEWAGLSQEVLVMNTKQNASVNLATGVVTARGDVSTNGIIPYSNDSEFRAVVVPQTVSAGKTLFLLTVGGKSYSFKKDVDMNYDTGRLNNFSIIVDKKIDTGDYQFTLLSESITPWENDNVTHDATLKEYLVINSTQGHLKDSIMAAGRDYTQVKNLKVTGEITIEDFYFMRDEMTKLTSLNLKEVLIKKVITSGEMGSEYKDYAIPEDAFNYGIFASNTNATLVNIVLPDKLTEIGDRAFSSCSKLMGSLTIPEGVTSIGEQAFHSCTSLTGKLTLPSTLKIIGREAFYYCGFTSELLLPLGLEVIGPKAFADCRKLYGNLVLPESLKEIGREAFALTYGFTGDLTIPQNIKEIKDWTFSYAGFNGTLTLHDGIEKIGGHAFGGCNFKGELVLPKELVHIEDFAFEHTDFTWLGELPNGLVSIGRSAFSDCTRLMGIIEMPEGLQQIGGGAFSNCNNLEGIVLPSSLEYIGDYGFANCFYLGNIITKNYFPPKLGSGVFDGVAKDNFAVEVPEGSVNNYKTATGWSDFVRISEHHELTVSPRKLQALNSAKSQEIVLRAEGDWIVESKPDWCSLSMSEGSGSIINNITITINELAHGAGYREGEIIFKLKKQGYRTSFDVSQYDYEYDENEMLTLQTATKGDGINIVLLGDAYDGKAISEGKYLSDMQNTFRHFFNIEPYNTYRDYFNVFTAFALSQNSVLGTVNDVNQTSFNVNWGKNLTGDENAIFQYAIDNIAAVTEANLKKSLIIMVLNEPSYGGVTSMYADGSAIAYCPLSEDPYPYDFQGIVQHEAGGHGFGKLADECIWYNVFIDRCPVRYPPHPHVPEFNTGKSYGWYDNLELTGNMYDVGWSHLMSDNRYNDIVDIYEGGYFHSRGVFRSEQNSCMNNNIPYFSTISRESIVKRIKSYAGEVFSFEDFVSNDNKTASTRSMSYEYQYNNGGANNKHQHEPIVHRGSPLLKK